MKIVNKDKFLNQYDKQDRQGKAALNERSPHPTSNKRQRQGAQEDPKEKQDRAQGRVRAGKEDGFITCHEISDGSDVILIL
jgi:hypothetical protein